MKKLLVLFCCMASSVLADGFMLKEENDVFARPATDHYYTQGLSIDYVCDPTVSGEVIERDMYGIRNLIYTPSNIKIATPQPWDRPWAGLLAGTFTKQELAWDDYTTKQWMIGVVGPWSQSGEIQTWFHGLIGSPEPMGWKNQIPNEPILNYNWNTYREIWFVGDSKGWCMDLTRQYGYSAGTAFDNVEGGFIGRAGWNLPRDYGISPINPTITYRSIPEKLSAYVLAGATGRGVLYNVTLGGSLFQDGPSQTLKPFVSDEQIGADVGVRDLFGSKVNLDLSYSLVFRSREFVGQEDNMQFGSIAISLMRGF